MNKLLLFVLMVGLGLCISYWVDPDRKETEPHEDDLEKKSEEEE